MPVAQHQIFGICVIQCPLESRARRKWNKRNYLATRQNQASNPDRPSTNAVLNLTLIVKKHLSGDCETQQDGGTTLYMDPWGH